MGKLSDKVRAITAAITAIEKQFGKGAIMNLGGPEVVDVPVISTGSLGLDLALGVGGLPRGRVIEVFGPESSGKTTLTLHAIAAAQRAGGVCAFVDAEHALDVTYAKRLGVDLGSLLVSQPDCGEQALEITDQLVRTGAVDLIVVDSVAALTPRAEIEGEMGDAHMGLQARLMSQALRKLTAITSKQGCTVIFINQLPTPDKRLEVRLLCCRAPADFVEVAVKVKPELAATARPPVSARITTLSTGVTTELSPNAGDLAQRVLEAARLAAGRAAQAWSVTMLGVLYVRVDGGRAEAAAETARAVLEEAGVVVDVG